MTTQTLSDALSGNYMLVSVSLRAWSGKRTDRNATQEVIVSKQATQDSGAFVKKLLASADEELKMVHAAANDLRSFVYARTLPWSMNSDGARRGERLIATADSMQFLKDVSVLKQAYDDAVLALQSVWPQRVTQALCNLGGLANASDYPSAASLPSFFGMTFEVRPLPATSDFKRLSVPAELADALANRMEQQAELQVENAMIDLRSRLTAELERIATQLGKYGSGEKAKLYETLVTNTQEIVKLARTMNLANNPRLADLADRIEAKLLMNPVEVYRNSVARSAEAATAATELLAEAQADDIWF